ncbi:DUF1631 family protein [Luteimonas sp. MJ204]|uniref:DUF1631 family protein n=1 Tax=Luteimonas sp. MJ145 TaxID=3129234 RepID=UPI0031BBA5A5
MQHPDRSGDSGRVRATRQSGAPDRLLEALHLGFRARLQPLLAAALGAAEAALRQALAGSRDEELVEALANVLVLGHEKPRSERSWQGHLGRGFEGWPKPFAEAAAASTLALVSDGELHAQLIGQPTIDALGRRFASVQEIIDGRLCSLASAMGGEGRPTNPFAPRAVVDAYLDTFSAVDCDPLARRTLLQHYERLCIATLTEAYAWLNAALAEGGHAMDGASAGAALLAQGVDMAGAPAWLGHDALQPVASSWRRGEGGDAAPGAGRGQVLRRRLGRPLAGAGDRDRPRAYGHQEFISMLSLVQGSETPNEPLAVPGSIAAHLRDSLLSAAEGLGIPRDLALASQHQDDAISVAGGLFDGLCAGAVLTAGARARLARLAWPWLRLALDDEQLFDDAGHPAMELLSGLVQCWDANAAAADDESALHALADAIADSVANGYHGEAMVFVRALAALTAGLEPLQRRAAISERRAWQAIHGKERLQAARREADALVAARLDGRSMLPAVSEFLSGAWHQALVLLRLRDGPGSERHAGIVALGDDLLRIDAAAAAARGGEVADGLLAIVPRLKSCIAAGGAGEAESEDALARLVAEFVRPDAPRSVVHAALPSEQVGDREPGADRGDPPPPGQVFISRQDGGQVLVWLRLAWTSPISGNHMLATRQGARHALMSADELDAAVAAGTLLPRPVEGPVEAVLRELAAGARSD